MPAPSRVTAEDERGWTCISRNTLMSLRPRTWARARKHTTEFEKAALIRCDSPSFPVFSIHFETRGKLIGSTSMASYPWKIWKKSGGFGLTGSGPPPTDDLTSQTRDSLFSAQLVKLDPTALDAESLFTAKIVGEFLMRSIHLETCNCRSQAIDH